MGKIRQINIKNRTYYFYNGQINLKDFDARFLKIDKNDFYERLLKVDKKDYNEIDIYYIGYVTIKKNDNCNNINSVNPLYLMIDEMIGNFEEKNKNKYLFLNDVDQNKKVSKKVWKGVKKELESFNGGEKIEYGKDYMKIKFKSNDDLPLNKLTKLRLLTITFKCVISEDGKLDGILDLDLKNMFVINVMIY